MSASPETITSWATAISAIFSVIGVMQSQPRLVIVSACCLAASLLLGVRLKQERRALAAARIEIEGRSIDALNLANLRRRVNRTLAVQEVSRLARICGTELSVVATYSGYCRGTRETAMEFSINTEHGTRFADLECRGFDLLADPEQKHAIRPVLLGPDGNAKKILVPFLNPLEHQRPFKMCLTYRLPGCMARGIEYYSAGLSFEQEAVPVSTVRLVFVGDLPTWVRVYDVNGGTAWLVRTLSPAKLTGNSCEYVDAAENVPGQSLRVFLFAREAGCPNRLCVH